MVKGQICERDSLSGVKLLIIYPYNSAFVIKF
jgi:hypothetical protein